MIGGPSIAAGSYTQRPGIQYVSIKYTERLRGGSSLVGSVGDSYDKLSPRRSTVSTRPSHPSARTVASFEAVEFAR